MRKSIAVFLLACALLLSVPAAALTGDAQRAADILVSLNLASGTPDGYRLEDTATLPQAAVLLVKLLGAQEAAQAETRQCGWVDMPVWARDAINYCAWNGLVRAEEYAPFASLSGEQWSAMLLRAVGHSDTAQPLQTAQRIALISHRLGDTVTRGEMFETALEALTFPTGDGTLLSRLLDNGLCEKAQVNALGLLSEQLSARQIADRKLSAILCLELYDSKEAVEQKASSFSASAFFIREDGIAVTNFHSIDRAIYGTGELVTGEVIEIKEVLYYDMDYDLAVIRMDDHTVDGTPIERFNTLELVGSADARIGDIVYAAGNPLGLGFSLSAGVVSAVEHEASLSTLPCVVCDAAISKGSSGGALMNLYGQVIGVTTGAYTSGNNMFLAVPVDPIMAQDLSGEGMDLFLFVNEVNARRLNESGRASA